MLGGGMFTSDTQPNENFAGTREVSPGAPELLRQTLQIATTEQWLLCDVVTLWLCLYTGAKYSPCSLCPGSAQGWVTFRNPFQPLFLMVL